MAKTQFEIASAAHDLRRARRARQQALMYHYDRTHYFPALAALQKECGAIGHVEGFTQNNGLGVLLTYCAHCGICFKQDGA